MNSNLHLKYFISQGIFLVAIGLVILGSLVSEVCMWIGLILAIIAAIISFTIRCPSCGCHLVRRGYLWLPNFCHNCGQQISGSEHEE